MRSKRAMVAGALVAAVCVRVVSAAPVLPDSIAGLKLWLKADALSLSDGDDVTTWANSWLAGNDAVAETTVQGQAFVPPKFKTGQINGRPAVRFSNSANDLMQAPDIFGGVTTFSDATFIAVYSVHGDSTSHSRTHGFGSYTFDENIIGSKKHFDAASDPSLRFDGTAIISGYLEPHPRDEYLIRSTIKSGDIYSEFFGGATALPATTKAGIDPIDDFFLGDLRYIPGANNVDIAEVIVYNSALSSADRQGIEEYLRAKYFPEPTTLTLVGLGGLGLAIRRRRRA